MLIVAGWLRVDPATREVYVARCRTVVEQARSAPGCRAFSLTADSVDDGLVLVHEQWDDEAALLAFRELPADDVALPDVLDAEVRRYTICEVGPA